jgi:5'-phosphate synthase pdxT subunit
LEIEGLFEPMHAVFIRAPWITELGNAVEVLTTVRDPESGARRPVVVRQGRILATSFHPELTDDTRIHEMLLAMAEES